MNNTILMLADPNEPQLDVLENLRAEANIITGNSVKAFGSAARDATVLPRRPRGDCISLSFPRC
jgi:hypothetical protein